MRNNHIFIHVYLMAALYNKNHCVGHVCCSVVLSWPFTCNTSKHTSLRTKHLLSELIAHAACCQSSNSHSIACVPLILGNNTHTHTCVLKQVNCCLLWLSQTASTIYCIPRTSHVLSLNAFSLTRRSHKEPLDNPHSCFYLIIREVFT